MAGKPRYRALASIDPQELAEFQAGIRKRYTDEQIVAEITAWNQDRNAVATTIDWRFTTADARIRLKRLYPVLKEQKDQKAA